MAEEFFSLHQTNTWDLVPLLPSKSFIGFCQVYKIKTKLDGSVDHYKARLVVKGFTQKYGMDYEKIFAPIAKMTTIQALIMIASIRQWHISQINVKSFLLNGDLKNEVYMVPFLGVFGEVCRLKKALYVSNKPLEPGLTGFLQWLLSLVFILVLMIQLFLLGLPLLVIFFFHFSLMT